MPSDKAGKVAEGDTVQVGKSVELGIGVDVAVGWALLQPVMNTPIDVIAWKTQILLFINIKPSCMDEAAQRLALPAGGRDETTPF